MSNQLLVLPTECKDNINQEHKSIIDKIINNYEIFYVDNNSYENFKAFLSDKKFEKVVYAYSNIIRDYKNLRAIKSVNLKSKLVLLYPQISNTKLFGSTVKNIYDEVYNLLEKSSDMEISCCQLADAVIIYSQEEKDLLTKLLNEDVVIETAKDVLNNGISFKEQSKFLVSIVMLTYNQLDDTKICVESLFKHTQGINFELIFVDNGSTKDKTKEYLEELKKQHSNIKTIYNDENLGFACANNQGIEISEGEYVLLLNNDVILSDGWLDKLLLVLKSNKKAGMVVPCTNHASGRQKVVFEANPEDDDLIQEYAKTTLVKQAGSWINVDRVIGFCMLIKREVLFKVGVLDEMFGPGGYEDYDYCMRIRQAGYNIVVAEDTFIFHIGGKGYSSNNMDYMELRNKNIELLIDKWTRQTIKIMEKLPDGM